MTDLLELAGAKTPEGSRRTLAERSTVQSEVARAEAALRAARGLLVDALERGYARAQEGAGIGTDERLALRLAATHAGAQRRERGGRLLRARRAAARSTPRARCNAAFATCTRPRSTCSFRRPRSSSPAGCCWACPRTPHSSSRTGRSGAYTRPVPAIELARSSSASARSPRWTGSTSRCPRASASACSGPTAPASRRRCGCSPARRSPTRASCACSATSCPREAKAARAEMGVVPQLDNLDVDVTVEDNLAVFARLYRVHGRRRRGRRGARPRPPAATAAATRSTSSPAGCAAACCSPAGSSTTRS